MEIAIIAHDLKKELMTQFCIAYCGVLSKHSLCATNITAKYITEATGLEVERLLSGVQGGEQQIASRIAYNEIDMLLYFKDTRPNSDVDEVEKEILRLIAEAFRVGHGADAAGIQNEQKNSLHKIHLR